MRNWAVGCTRRLVIALALVLSSCLSANALAYPTHTLTKGQWSLISLPADPGDNGTVENLFGDDLSIGSYGSSGLWVVYTFDSSTGQYVEIAADETLKPNVGYWIVQLISDSVELDIPDSLKPLARSEMTACPEGEQCVAHTLLSSDDEIMWNLVGYSSTYETTYGNSVFVAEGSACETGCSPEDALAANVANSVLYRYNPDNAESPYEAVTADTELSAWDGYWLAVLPGSGAPEWVLPVLGNPRPPEAEATDPDINIPKLTYPLPGTQLSGTDVTVKWDANGASVERWQLLAGLSRGGAEIANGQISDPNADEFTFTGLPSDGTTTVYIQFAYRINGSWSSLDHKYLAFDGGNAANQDTVADPAPVATNQAPVAKDDSVGPLATSGTITVNVAANDTDADGSVIATSVAIVDAPASGLATVGSDGQITYVHNGSESESDSLTYTVKDNSGALSNTATVSISPINQPTPENQAPVAADDSVGPVNAAASLTFSVVDNDEDSDGSVNASSVTIVSEPSFGTAVVEADGRISYSHDGSTGTVFDTLSYTVLDDDDAVSNAATVMIAINDERTVPGDTNLSAQVRDAGRLLMQGAFGPSDAAINQVIDQGGREAWVDAQLALSPTRHLPVVKSLFPNQNDQQEGRYRAFWDRAIRANDQLRQRVAFALSHILVISDKATAIRDKGNLAASYYDVLITHAFGNFRDLMQDVTLHPAMGIYLSMMGNDKPDIASGRRADENYARELMQLFTIGLVGLNIDGTEIEGTLTYTEDDVVNLARVFTGWSWDVDRWRPNHRNGWNSDRTAMERPMAAFPEHHDTDTKVFLGMDMPAGQSPEVDLQMALDRLFTHPNVAPFISKQLIKRLVTSNPSRAYVARIASTFNNNGNGVRGDLGAVVRAILLDQEARDEATSSNDDYGKLRESMLRYAHMWRAFRVTDPVILNRNNAQHYPQIAPLTAPSVFNFFRPTYAPPGTLSNAGLVAPEFQLNSETNLNDVNKALMRGVIEDKFHNANVRLNLNIERRLLSDPQALLLHLDRILLAGRMTDGMRQILNQYISENKGTIDDDRILRDVIGLVVTSTEFAVQR